MANLWRNRITRYAVDYRPFKANRLKRRPDLVIPDGPNEYGMRLVTLTDPAGRTATPTGGA